MAHIWFLFGCHYKFFLLSMLCFIVPNRWTSVMSSPSFLVPHESKLFKAFFGMFTPLRKHAQRPHFGVIVSPTFFPCVFLLWSCWAGSIKLSWLVATFSFDVGQIVQVFFVVATACVRLSGKSRRNSQYRFQAAVCDNKLSVQYLFKT